MTRFYFRSKIRRSRLAIFLMLIGLFTYSCAKEADPFLNPTEVENDGTIRIESPHILLTESITVSSGAQIVVINNDSMSHHLASQSAADAFDDTGDFEMLVPSGGRAVLTMPVAASGTTFFFYDKILKESLLPTGGTITIE